MTLERARGHDGWRARRPDLSQPSQAARSRNSASAPRYERPMSRRPGASAVATPTSTGQNAEVLTDAASAIAVGKRRRCTSRSQSGGPQPTGDRERNRPPVAPELGKQTRAEGQEMTPALTRQVRRDLVSARVPDRPESEHLSIRVLAPSLLTIRPKQKSAALRAGYSNVAQAALSARLLLSARSGSDRSVSTMPVPWERRSALTERRRPAHRQNRASVLARSLLTVGSMQKAQAKSARAAQSTHHRQPVRHPRPAARLPL
jgi:hypothetical protein